ncbi:T9SS type A sorting domain-containing protein, partial [Umezakia ovalisporum]|uniref:T9SS type A sorting domain-containing protein n=1 Tax=Umezakia ovalisporum TaxID=75695 RepID=UPI0039C70DF7
SAVLANRGTVALSGIDLLAEFQGGLTIRERFAGPILPKSEAVYNFVSQAVQDRNGLQVVCVTALLPADDSLSDNSACGSLASSFTVLPLNPNPVENGSLLTVRYSLPSEGGVKVQLVDVLGRESYTLFDGVEAAGYKEKTIGVNTLTPGLYSVRVIFQVESVAQRLVVR